VMKFGSTTCQRGFVSPVAMLAIKVARVLNEWIGRGGFLCAGCDRTGKETSAMILSPVLQLGSQN
jgi:hypothetical protein